MKIYFSSLALLCSVVMLPLGSHAQHEIDLGTGLPNPDACNLSELFAPNTQHQMASFVPSINATYRYFFTSHISAGLTMCYYADKGAAVATNDEYKTYNIGNYRRSNFVIAYEMTFINVKRPFFIYYMLTGFGARFTNSTYDYVPGSIYIEYWDPLSMRAGRSIAPMIQLTPIGMRFGGRFGGFLEIGIGYRGILNCGMYYKP